MKFYQLVPFLAIALVASEPPNVIIFVADDLGIGDVGCFGNAEISTPNIDRLCREGVKLNQHLAAAAVCTPSRAALMTGRYAARSGLDVGIPGDPLVLIYPHGKAGLSDKEKTWAVVLKEAGYSTAAVGKWHLGWDKDSCGDNAHGPLGHGFDNFFGVPHTLVKGIELETSFWTFNRVPENLKSVGVKHLSTLLLMLVLIGAMFKQDFKLSAGVFLVSTIFIVWLILEHFSLKTWFRCDDFINKHLNCHLVDNGTVVESPILLEGLAANLTQRSLEFIRKSVKHDKKFALYHSFTNVHTPLVTGNGFDNSYRGSVMEMDFHVGQILNLLDQLNVADDTFIYFTSDHGADIGTGDPGGSNAPFSGGKAMGAIEGAIRVPAAIRWPGKVNANTKISLPTSLMDIFPTLIDVVGQRQPEDVELDGRSFYKLLVEGEDRHGGRLADAGRVFRHYCGNRLQAIRLTFENTVFKAFFFRHRVNELTGRCNSDNPFCTCFPNDVEEFFGIFDLDKDPGEKKPLDGKHPLHDVLSRRFKQELKKATGKEEEPFPPSQLSSPYLVFPRPWMMPPFCGGSSKLFWF